MIDLEELKKAIFLDKTGDLQGAESIYLKLLEQEPDIYWGYKIYSNNKWKTPSALRVKTYLMLPYTTDWRWFEDTKTSPWYKSVEIFKQTDPISWENVISEIVEKLKSFK